MKNPLEGNIGGQFGTCSSEITNTSWLGVKQEVTYKGLDFREEVHNSVIDF